MDRVKTTWIPEAASKILASDQGVSNLLVLVESELTYVTPQSHSSTSRRAMVLKPLRRLCRLHLLKTARSVATNGTLIPLFLATVLMNRSKDTFLYDSPPKRRGRWSSEDAAYTKRLMKATLLFPEFPSFPEGRAYSLPAKCPILSRQQSAYSLLASMHSEIREALVAKSASPSGKASLCRFDQSIYSIFGFGHPTPPIAPKEPTQAWIEP